MIITSLRLHQFRNYRDACFSFPQSVVVLHGSNGQGKTNLLEALYMGSIGKSYRNGSDNDCLHWEAGEGSIIISFQRGGVEEEVKIVLSREDKKAIFVNGTNVKHRELIGTLQAVIFSPDDLQLIKGSPSLRRRFLDMEISQVSPAYYKTLLQYNRSLAQRNFLLKQMKYTGRRSLTEWDRQIARFAAQITAKRLDSLHKIAFLSGVIHRRLTGSSENLSLSYMQPYVEDGRRHEGQRRDEEWYFSLLQHNLDADIQRMSTSVGPHRDDLVFAVDGAELKRYGSQGQQRTAVLALKMSELEYIKSESGEYPVLLLDDVMSELDQKRRQGLLDFVRSRIQTFITTTEPGMFQTVKDCRFIGIKRGKAVQRD